MYKSTTIVLRRRSKDVSQTRWTHRTNSVREGYRLPGVGGGDLGSEIPGPIRCVRGSSVGVKGVGGKRPTDRLKPLRARTTGK